MDFGLLLDDALSYTKQGVFGDMNRWIKLILAIICIGLPFNGYVMRIYRGAHSAPEVDQWGTLVVDGLKLLIVGLIYAIPLFVLWVLAYGRMLMAVASGNINSVMIQSWTPNLIFVGLIYVIEIIIAVIVPVASIRFARTSSFAEAFNFSAIFGTIRKIGWINYIIALILISLVIGIPICIIIFGMIAIGGIAIWTLGGGIAAILGLILALVLVILVLAPLFGVFQARYMTLVYDSADSSVPSP